MPEKRGRNDPANIWKKEAEAKPEKAILDQWSEFHRSVTGARRGNWKPLQGYRMNPGKKFTREPGLLVLEGAKWNLYFYHVPSFFT